MNFSIATPPPPIVANGPRRRSARCPSGLSATQKARAQVASSHRGAPSSQAASPVVNGWRAVRAPLSPSPHKLLVLKAVIPRTQRAFTPCTAYWRDLRSSPRAVMRWSLQPPHRHPFAPGSRRGHPLLVMRRFGLHLQLHHHWIQPVRATALSPDARPSPHGMEIARVQTHVHAVGWIHAGMTRAITLSHTLPLTYPRIDPPFAQCRSLSRPPFRPYDRWSHGHFLYADDGSTIRKGNGGNSWDSSFPSAQSASYMAVYCCWQY